MFSPESNLLRIYFSMVEFGPMSAACPVDVEAHLIGLVHFINVYPPRVVFSVEAYSIFPSRSMRRQFSELGSLPVVETCSFRIGNLRQIGSRYHQRSYLAYCAFH